MAKRDFYEVLGVQKGADEAALKAAYRKLAKQFHPDVNTEDPKAEAKFKEASEAYEILKDPQKRAAYDQFGHAAFNGGGGPGGMGGFGFDPGTAFSDIFEDLFGDLTGRGRARGQGAGRGSDLRYNMTITLAEAFKGKQAEIHVGSSVACDHCKGSGAEPGSSPVTCRPGPCATDRFASRPALFQPIRERPARAPHSTSATRSATRSSTPSTSGFITDTPSHSA